MSHAEGRSELLRAVLQDPNSREFQIDGIARDLSKHGNFNGHESKLDLLAEILGEAEVVSLYQRFADSRLEFEWRDEFKVFFEGAEEYLPTPQISAEEFDRAWRSGEVRSPDGMPVRHPDRLVGRPRRWWEFWR